MSARELLYNLLPAVYRIRDQEPHTIGGQERRDQLRALLGIIEEQLDCLEEDVAGLAEDWFIETCAEWVVPYIGDLLGVRLLHNIESSGLYSQRALVANTLRYRRRKGTLLVLEDLARDVTGWKAHAVEFFQLLGWTQNLNHLRYQIAANPNPRNPDVLNPYSANRVGTVNLRGLDVVDRIDGPFDLVTHTVDVRPVGQLEGWHNIRNIGIFTWRLQSYPMLGVQPRASEDYADGFHFSPLGHPGPLFTNPEPKEDEKAAGETNVPGAIRPVAFFQRPDDYYGSVSHLSFAIYRGSTVDDDNLIAPEEIMCKDLSTWSPPPGPGHPIGERVAVDVERGRIAFAPGRAPEELTVTYHYGFSADVGGGPYDRRATLEPRLTGDWVRVVAREQPEGVPADEHETTLRAAIDAWAVAQPARAIITIADNATYEEEISIGLADTQHLFIQADDRNRPTVRFVDGVGALAELTVTGPDGNAASLTLDGLLIEGGVRVEDDALRRLEIRDCTLVPGRALAEDGRARLPAAASLVVEPDSDELEITIERSIVGALRLPDSVRALTVRDGIIDKPEEDVPGPRFAIAADDGGAEPGPACTIERVTIFGDVFVSTMDLASEVMFADAVSVIRRQIGCVRYSYVDDLVSVTPRRFRCQPDLALATRRKVLRVETLPAAEARRIRARVRPRFSSMRYGRPDYAQLFFDIAEEIRTGAEDGAEMGAFEHLKQPQRVANLRARLEEYVPYGLDTGIVYVT